MKKIFGILGLLVTICVVTSLVSDRFLTAYNIENLLRRSSLFGIIGIGAAFVIITNGIDLSIGSIVGLIGCLLPMALVSFGVPLPAGLLIPVVVFGLLALGALLGFGHGILVTKIRLQPFVVTLCGLLIYRGVARHVTRDETQGFGTGYEGLRSLAVGRIELPFPGDFALPVPCLVLIVVALAAGFFLNFTVWGRYMLALGRNVEAARYSGVPTDRVIILAYMICATLAALGGILFVLDVNSAQPVDFGNFYELYAIAAAVLGGCSLRGGEGTILGVIIGAAVMQVLRTAITLVGISSQLEYAIIGGVILLGVVADEVVKRAAAQRRD